MNWLKVVFVWSILSIFNVLFLGLAYGLYILFEVFGIDLCFGLCMILTTGIIIGGIIMLPERSEDVFEVGKGVGNF